MEAWNFYWRTATPYVREYGLMPVLLARTGRKGVAREIFEAKQSAIHDARTEVDLRNLRKAKEDGEKSPADLDLTGDDNG